MPFEEELIRELESFGRVVSKEMTEESSVFAYRRDKEVDLLQKHIDRAQQKSLLLVGPSGCGKSAILQQLIQVMPLVEDPDSDHDHVIVTAKKARGEALRCGRFRAEVTATERSSGIQVSIRSASDLEEAKAVAQDLLRAECRRQQEQAHRAAPEDAGSVVRRYTLRPSQSAKDLRSGVMQYNLRNLWKGALDEFLLAVLEKN